MSIKQRKNVVWSLIQKLPANYIVKQEKNLHVKENIQVLEDFSPLSALTPSHVQLFLEIKDQLEQIKDKLQPLTQMRISSFLYQLTPKYEEGQLMQKIIKLKKLIVLNENICQIQEDAEIEFQNEIVYVLYFWKSGSINTDKNLEQIQSIFEKNTGWIGKVKLIGINLKKYNESLLEDIKQKYWKSIEHYQISRIEEEILFSRNESQFMLINKSGIVIEIGSCVFFGLEEHINELLANGYDAQEVKEKIQKIDFFLDEEDAHTELQYKELKNWMKKISIFINEAGLNGKVVLEMDKISYWKPDGTKIFYSCSPLKLKYNVLVDKRPQIIELLENYWNKIPKNLKSIQEEIIKDPENSFRKFKEIFFSLGAEIYYLYSQQTDINLNKAKNSFEVTQNQNSKLFAKNLNYDVYFKAKQILNELLQKNSDFDFYDLLQELKVNQLDQKIGQQYLPISQCKKWEEDTQTSIEHEPGQVMIIKLWQDCKHYNIQYYAEYLKQNQQKWGNSVRAVAVNLRADDSETMQECQQYKNYLDYYSPMTYDYYFFFGGTFLQETKFPITFLVDKYGTIRDSNKYEIENLLQEQQLQKLEDEGDFAEEAALNLINFTQEAETREKLLQIDKLSFLDFKIHLEMHKILDQVKFEKPILNVSCWDFQLQDVNQILKNLFQFIPENQWKINKQVQKTISVEYPGAVCAVCQKNILQQPQQYYSPFKNEHVCVECAEFDDQTYLGSKRFKYLDTLIFINGPLTDLSVLKYIEEEKIGKNLQSKFGQVGSQLHEQALCNFYEQVFCNGCRKQKLQGARYIAANAKAKEYDGYIDYCQACFLVLKNKKSEEAQEIIKKSKEYGMTEDSLLIRILFSHGYRNF